MKKYSKLMLDCGLVTRVVLVEQGGGMGCDSLDYFFSQQNKCAIRAHSFSSKQWSPCSFLGRHQDSTYFC